MLTKTAFTLGVLFAVAATPASAQALLTCDSSTERPMTMMELTKPVFADQAVTLILELDTQSPLWPRLKDAANSELGAILNEGTRDEGLRFDPDSAYRLNKQSTFERIPHIVVHACANEMKRNVLEISQAVARIEGIKLAAPDAIMAPTPTIKAP